MDTVDFDDLRRDYDDDPLERSDLTSDPLQLLRDWLAAARDAGVSEPNAMALATCGADGQPHCRIVLLKQVDEQGLAFFTNKGSDKGAQIAANPQAAATFWWSKPRNRQVRIVGSIVPTPETESDRYFESRPREAQLASAASPQSSVVRDREELERLVTELRERVGTGAVPRPPQWGGYRLRPHQVEFWQGRAARLHDRLRYRRDGSGWVIERLAP
ncbi:MAG: pyridoxamine 5'-phosphate oxidase [Planctomycetota bacterium]